MIISQISTAIGKLSALLEDRLACRHGLAWFLVNDDACRRINGVAFPVAAGAERDGRPSDQQRIERLQMPGPGRRDVMHVARLGQAQRIIDDGGVATLPGDHLLQLFTGRA